MYFIHLSKVLHSIVIVCRIYFTTNITQSANPYANSDIIFAFFKYSNLLLLLWSMMLLWRMLLMLWKKQADVISRLGTPRVILAACMRSQIGNLTTEKLQVSLKKRGYF